MSREKFAFVQKEREKQFPMTGRLGSMGASGWDGWVERTKRDYGKIFIPIQYINLRNTEYPAKVIHISYDIIYVTGVWYDVSGDRPLGMRVEEEESNKKG